jgi:hypothetical protein
MAEYKAPRGRQAIKNKVKVVLMDWIEENLDDSGDTNTAWDAADDCAARTYEYETEEGNRHPAAMKEAKMVFWDQLRAELGTQLEGVFERLGKE